MAIALVSHVGVSQIGSTATTTSAIDTTGATLLVAQLSGFGGGTPAVGTITDSKGNTWTLLTQVDDGSGGVTGRLAYVANPTVGASHTFTISGTKFTAIAVAAFSGVVTSSPFDVQSASGSLVTPVAPGSVTPTNTNSLVVAGSGAGVSGSTYSSVSGGFTFTDKIVGSSGNSISGCLSYLIQTTIAAANPSFVYTGGGKSVANQAVFIAAAAPLSIAVPVGSMAFTTYTPGVSVGISVPVGTLTITGHAPAVTISIPIPLTTLAITSYAPGVTIAVAVPVATMAFTTYAPALAFTTGIPVPKGTLAITTYAPQVQNVYISVPARTLTITTYVPTLSFDRHIEVPVASLLITTYAPVVFIGNIGPCDDRFGPKIYFWEPSYLIRPEDTFLRATDWDAAGYDGLKFVQGLIIEADTEGQTREIMIQGDQLDVETLTINHNGQLEKPYSLNQPVLKHLLRLLPTDLSAHWRLFNVRWVYEPAPEFAKEWKTQGTDHDIPGFQFLKDGYIAHASTADITFNVTVDDVTFTYTIPHSSGQYVKTYLIFGIKPTGRTTKGTLFTYELTSSEPFQLYQKDCEVRVHDWKGGEYVVKQPFGDISRVYGARI